MACEDIGGVVIATTDNHDAVPSSPQSLLLWTIAGVPTRLIRKKTLVEAAFAVDDDMDGPPLRLPVHTLTFAMPPPRDDEDDDDDEKKKNEKNNGQKKKKVRLHHRDLRLDRGDIVKMVIPGYKPKSYSVSALREHEFDVTVKVYPNGRASGYLDRLQIHDEIYTFGLSKGLRRNDDDSIITHVGVIAYGVGITEALPVVTAELRRSSHHDNINNAPDIVVTLLWAARTKADTFWHNELAELRRTYPHTFRLQYIFSREKDETGFVLANDNDNNNNPADPLPPPLQGRIDAAVLQRVFVDGPKQSTTNSSTLSAASFFRPRFLSVGTKEMMAQTDQMLAAIGYPMPEYALLK